MFYIYLFSATMFFVSILTIFNYKTTYKKIVNTPINIKYPDNNWWKYKLLTFIGTLGMLYLLKWYYPDAETSTIRLLISLNLTYLILVPFVFRLITSGHIKVPLINTNARVATELDILEAEYKELEFTRNYVDRPMFAVITSRDVERKKEIIKSIASNKAIFKDITSEEITKMIKKLSFTTFIAVIFALGIFVWFIITIFY
ncbi:MAG: hypothetical protein QM489_07730 [Candidatus Izemoplasma sp.]